MTDVLVVGGGPSGATTASLLARAGLDVLLLDRARFPRPKPCAEYLSPGVLHLLGRLGVREQVEAAGGPRLHGFIVHAHGRATMTGSFGRASGWRDRPAYGLGVPRADLDAILLDSARRAGVCVREGVRVTDVERDGSRVIGVRALAEGGTVEFGARLVVGADGVHGVVGRRLGLVRLRPGLRRLSLVAHVEGITGLGGYGEMHVGRQGYCGVAPLRDGLANVALVLRPALALRVAGRPQAALLDLLNTFPGMAARVGSAAVVGEVLRTGPLSLRAERMVAAGALLVGDAGGFYDPFTGQGVYKALRSAELAAPVIAEALAAGDVSARRLAAYERARRSEFRGVAAVEWLVQRFLDQPALLCRALRLLGERTAMANTLVGVTGDVLPAQRVLAPWFLARLAI